MQFRVFLCPSVCVWVSFGVLCLCVAFASAVSVDGRSSKGVSLHGRLCMFLFGARVPACSSSWLLRSASRFWVAWPARSVFLGFAVGGACVEVLRAIGFRFSWGQIWCGFAA